MKKSLKLTQIAIAQWDGDNGRTYSTIGLDAEGRVWKYSVTEGGWIPFSMEMRGGYVGDSSPAHQAEDDAETYDGRTY